MKAVLNDISLSIEEKKNIRQNYIVHITNINQLYSEIKENIDNVEEYYLEEEPEIILDNLDFIEEDKKKKSEFLKKQLLRTTKLIVIAIFISIFSYFVFGNMFVKFGILHFMAFSSLLVLPFVDSPKIISGIIGITIFIRYLVNKNPMKFMNINPKFAFITGLYSSYGAVDHFPITPWIIFICIGLILGRVITNKKNSEKLKELEDKKIRKDNKLTKGLQWCGKNSLEIYIVHWVILFLFFAYIYPKIRLTN